MYMSWNIHSLGMSIRSTNYRGNGTEAHSLNRRLGFGPSNLVIPPLHRLLNPAICFSVSLSTHKCYKKYKLLNSRLSWPGWCHLRFWHTSRYIAVFGWTGQASPRVRDAIICLSLSWPWRGNRTLCRPEAHLPAKSFTPRP